MKSTSRRAAAHASRQCGASVNESRYDLSWRLSRLFVRGAALIASRNPKLIWKHIFAGLPSAPTFASPPRCDCGYENRGNDPTRSERFEISSLCSSVIVAQPPSAGVAKQDRFPLCADAALPVRIAFQGRSLRRLSLRAPIRGRLKKPRQQPTAKGSLRSKS